jgi:hypothetical protein
MIHRQEDQHDRTPGSPHARLLRWVVVQTHTFCQVCARIIRTPFSTIFLSVYNELQFEEMCCILFVTPLPCDCEEGSHVAWLFTSISRICHSWSSWQSLDWQTKIISLVHSCRFLKMMGEVGNTAGSPRRAQISGGHYSAHKGPKKERSQIWSLGGNPNYQNKLQQNPGGSTIQTVWISHAMTLKVIQISRAHNINGAANHATLNPWIDQPTSPLDYEINIRIYNVTLSDLFQNNLPDIKQMIFTVGTV